LLVDTWLAPNAQHISAEMNTTAPIIIPAMPPPLSLSPFDEEEEVSTGMVVGAREGGFCTLGWVGVSVFTVLLVSGELLLSALVCRAVSKAETSDNSLTWIMIQNIKI
jgi:hypothetical protein